MEQQSEEKAAEVQFEEKALEVSNSTETEKSVPDSELRIFLRKVRLSLEDTRVKVLFIIYNFINTCVILNAGFVKECSSIQEVAFVLNNCSIILVVSCLLMFGWTTDPKRKEFARDMCLIIDFNSCMLNVILWVPLILCLLHGKCDVCITQAEITTVLMLVYNTWNFLKMQGAELISIKGEIPHNKFVMLVDNVMLKADKQGLVKYSKYMDVRKKLKLKMWKQAHIIKVKKGDYNKQKTKIMLSN